MNIALTKQRTKLKQEETYGQLDSLPTTLGSKAVGSSGDSGGGKPVQRDGKGIGRKWCGLGKRGGGNVVMGMGRRKAKERGEGRTFSLRDAQNQCSFLFSPSFSFSVGPLLSHILSSKPFLQ